MMEIKKDFKNDLLKRREIQFSIESEKNPGFEESKSKITEKFKVEADNIAVKSIKNNFGTRTFLVDAFIYDSKESKERLEPKAKVKGGAK